jgi:hypothetical protein
MSYERPWEATKLQIEAAETMLITALFEMLIEKGICIRARLSRGSRNYQQKPWPYRTMDGQLAILTSCAIKLPGKVPGNLPDAGAALIRPTRMA